MLQVDARNILFFYFPLFFTLSDKKWRLVMKKYVTLQAKMHIPVRLDCFQKVKER